MASHDWSIALLFLGVVGCVAPQKVSTHAASSSRGSIAAAPSPSPTSKTARTEGRRLELGLKLDDHGLHVAIRATAPLEELREWKMGEDPPSHLEVRDGGGRPIAFTMRANDGGDNSKATMTIASPQATTVLMYDIERSEKGSSGSDKKESEDPRATLVASSQFRAVGEAILALPIAFAKKPFALVVDIDGRATDAPVVASSFGVARGHVRREADAIDAMPIGEMTGPELRRAAFLAGPGGHALFDAQEGHDEVAWLGYSAFDPRPVAAEVAVFRGTLRDHFKSELGPQMMMITVDNRPAGHFRVLRRTRGLLVALAGSDPFDATLRLAIAHELVHAWIGDRLWIGDARPGHEAETFWFHEGYARWVAREQLYRVGLLSPDEYAAEVNRLFSIVTTSPHAHRPMSELVADVKSGGVVPLLVARGALHATLVDQRLRTASKSKSGGSLDDVLRGLLRDVEEKHRAIPEEVWHAKLAALIGDAREKADHEELVVTGKRTSLPPDALGGCFELQESTYDVFDPGLDLNASRDASKVMGLRANGPAAKAGVREGDVLVNIEEPKSAAVAAGDNTKAAASPMMKIAVEREGKRIDIVYRASSGSRRGPSFKKRAGLSDDACRKLALRN